MKRGRRRGKVDISVQVGWGLGGGSASRVVKVAVTPHDVVRLSWGGVQLPYDDVTVSLCVTCYWLIKVT